MLGSFNNPLPNTAPPSLNRLPLSKAAAAEAKKQPLRVHDLIRHEWSELPYAMMRLTATRMSWDHHRLYWRDRKVQLGEIELTLARIRAEHDALQYAAAYKSEESRRDFTLYPSLEGDQVRWTAPGLCDTAKLTTPQLAEKLLSKLVTFYSTGLNAPASPDPSS